jgi:hypothetical protein
MNLDGTDTRKLCADSTFDLNVTGGRLYYVSSSDEGMLRSIDADGTDRWLIGEGGSPWDTDAIDARGNTNGNIVNGGNIAFDGDRIYYSSVSGGWTLHASRPDGRGRVKLCDDYAVYINVVGDTVYYVNNSDEGKVYSIKTDGTGRQKLCDDTATYVNVVGQTIYYSNSSDGGSLYRMGIDGSGRSQIVRFSAANINVVGDTVYYCWLDPGAYDFGWEICSVMTNGRNKKQVGIVPTPAYNLVVAEGRVYYTDTYDRTLLSMNLDGSDALRLVGAAVTYINVVGDRLYFAAFGDFTGFYSIDLGGGDRRVVLDAEQSLPGVVWAQGVYAAHDRLYFIAYGEGNAAALYSMGLDGEGLRRITN